jgi:hypothetical protein
MDPVSAFSTGVTATDLAHKGWGWWKRWRHGAVSITHPSNRAIVTPEWVNVEGVHKRAKGHFWLITNSKDEYWPQGEINLDPDGHWKATININPSPGPRVSVILLVRVNDFMHSILMDIKHRSQKGKCYDPIKMKPPKSLFSVVQGLVLQVQERPASTVGQK